MNLRPVKLSVSGAQHGMPLQAFLVRRLNLSGNQVKDLLDERLVFVNGRRIWMARHPLCAGDKLEVLRPAAPPPRCPPRMMNQDYVDDLVRTFVALTVPESLVVAAATIGVTVLATFATIWAVTFARHHAVKPERAWTMWMLYPSFTAVGATLMARYAWPIWSVVALLVVALPTIAVHAMFMGQRDRAGGAPQGALASIVAWLPVVSVYAVLAVLLVTGVVEFVR